MKYLFRILGVAVFACLALGVWAIFFGGDVGTFVVRNDTGQTVRVEACSQNRPAFPGAFTIEPHGSRRMDGDLLPADDPGAACYITSVAGQGAHAFHVCLEMPTRDDTRDTYKVSEGDRVLTRRQCFQGSNPGLPDCPWWTGVSVTGPPCAPPLSPEVDSVYMGEEASGTVSQ